ncbi:hypothetical protein GCK72_018479 [Caenorhabditis remanei]|uniref:IBR domain-containing protein n=1 Tax=Caenorhabditis remanei TaxID=31234 RepID=A0A6A5GBD2_CAERE|nr:hypothetical protein GCK72_018479 [Caenorhabditis remanei]KAF1751925.1 hypothetical protein GCK72_018479 [Caenorhabditis remanei]
MSEYAESIYADSVIDWDQGFDNYDETLTEKPRGQRRWLGKEHHRGKERLHNSVKDRTFIEKTVKSTDPLSKRSADRIEESTKDELKLNVLYSMDKKNRWNDATTVTLLRSAPENLNVEVVEKNALEQYGFLYPNKSTFAVHSRKVRQEDAPGEFEIRKATSTSSKGQDYSNFLPKSREFSKKANAKIMTVRHEEEGPVELPTVTYNIYKTHHSKDVVGSELFKAKVVSKSGRHRANKKIDMDVYDDDEYFDDEENEFEDSNHQSHARSILDLTDYVVENSKKQVVRSKRNASETSYEMIDHTDIEYSHQFNIQGYLNQEGFTFIESDITFSNQTACFEKQINELREERDLKIKDLRPNQYLIDITKRCQSDGAKKNGETTTVMVFTHLKQKTFNVLLNSTIICHPEKRSDEYLKKLISSATSILEAITRVSGELNQNRNTIDMISTSGKYYGKKDLTELLNDSTVWDFQTKKMQKMNWPNQHYHATWANSEELSQIGGKLEWNDLCEMVKTENRLKTCYTFEENCGECSRKKRSHELFLVKNESKVKCTDCLRNQFYREFMANRLPIDLETDTAEELEYLPTFIPLPLLNLYIRMVAETIYKDLGATGDFEKCQSCKSAVFFEDLTSENEKKSVNRSCPCGYSWCKECRNVPHWPMNCTDFSEWEKKWLLRYSMMHAQGSGSEALLQITCSCGSAIMNVLLPAGKFISCPNCKTNVNTETMHSIYEPYYWPYSPRQRERLRQYYRDHKNEDSYRYEPIAEIRTDITKIPAIKQSVMEVCGAARDVRFDLKFRNQMVKREHALIRKNTIETEVVENLFGTTAYLAENVTAWMHMSNQNDRNVKNTLETMMENRKNLIEVLEGGDQESIKECIRTLRIQIDSVVSSVEKKLNDATPRQQFSYSNHTDCI